MKIDLIDTYLKKWMLENNKSRVVDGFTEITTPFLDSHNDHIQIYAKVMGSDVYITDDGYTLSDLELYDANFSEKKEIGLKEILERYGVQLDCSSKEIYAKSTINDFPRVASALIQSIISINHVFSK